MSAPILYTSPAFIRTILPPNLVKFFNLNIKVVDIADDAEQFAKLLPRKHLPAIVFPDGRKLTQIVAVVSYLVELSGNKAEIETLLGSDKELDVKAGILMWEEYANSDFLPEMQRYTLPHLGALRFDEQNDAASKKSVDIMIEEYESYLQGKDYLVADRLTLADLLTTASFTIGFLFMWDEPWRTQHPNLTRYFKKNIQSKYLKEQYKDFKYCEKPLPKPTK